MTALSLKSVIVPLLGAAISLAMTPGPVTKDPTLARYYGRAVDPADTEDAGPVEVRIVKWSSDEEMATLRDLLAASQKAGTPLIFPRARPAAAVVFISGVRGLGARARVRRARTFQFAREIETPTGRQIVLATDQHPGVGEDGHTAAPTEPEFTLIDIRLGPDGTGVGKMVLAPSVAYNEQKKMIEIADFAAQPVRIARVRSGE
jgi:hypothetical protein